jgi:WD40 repeat protein
MSGFISWVDVKKSRQNVFEDEKSEVEEQQVQQPVRGISWQGIEHAHPQSLSRILRQREIGGSSGRSFSPSTRSIPAELKEHVFDDIGPQRFFQGTSGDVTCMAWAPEGNRFAAGSIAITDERSMQYNKPCNLLLGDTQESAVYELPEHHIQRPINTDIGNVNSLHSMRETQDERLFMTVGNVQFSPDGKTLYSAGMDGKARAYSVDSSNARTFCQYELEHPAAVYLLSVSNLDVLATACHQAADGCVRIYNGDTQFASLSPSRADNQTELPIYPSTLKWGTSWRHSNLLLAGFSIDSFDEERNLAGETCLWDVQHEKRIEVNAVTRNVFDVTWNPSPSSGSTAFAVASTPGVNKVNRGTRTVVQCFAPRQNRAAAVLEFELRAFDINDVTYCPHDNNLIAAGATDGKVYVWDQRYAKTGSGPLHALAHDHSLNVLDHDRERELADTGIRFLSWGATSSRLYSGSSDGVVKVWNPYRSTSEAHVKDIATFTSAVMSGAFSPDYRELLVGEDQGRINLLSVEHEKQSIRSMDRFELRQAPTSKDASIERSNGRTVARNLLEAGVIELRPMGALSKRQAVQGPNYKGPYLAPSGKELQEAEVEYQVALNLQNEEHSKAAAFPTQNSDVGQALLEADKRVQTAQEKLLQLQSRLDDSEVLRPRAEANQRKLKIVEEERTELEASLSNALEQCKLDCNYLPTNMDEDNEVTDSGRSERRIPAALWKLPEMNTNEMDANELIDAGLTHTCATCRKPARKPKSGLPSCESCARKRLGITATCEICSSPMRPTLEAKTPNLCERCNFSCFRCGKPAFLAPNATTISCYQCNLSWTAGVLGYELATSRKVSKPSDRMTTLDMETIRDEEMTG